MPSSSTEKMWLGGNQQDRSSRARAKREWYTGRMPEGRPDQFPPGLHLPSAAPKPCPGLSTPAPQGISLPCTRYLEDDQLFSLLCYSMPFPPPLPNSYSSLKASVPKLSQASSYSSSQSRPLTPTHPSGPTF